MDDSTGRSVRVDSHHQVANDMSGVTELWAEIEGEHAGIFGLLNRVRVVAAQNGLSAPAILPTCEAVVRRFEDHFANEEKLMAETGFPDADAHRRHHQILLIRLHSICDRMRTEQVAELEQLQLVFQSLLDDAIGVDASFREHLDQGLRAPSE